MLLLRFLYSFMFIQFQSRSTVTKKTRPLEGHALSSEGVWKSNFQSRFTTSKTCLLNVEKINKDGRNTKPWWRHQVSYRCSILPSSKFHISKTSKLWENCFSWHSHSCSFKTASTVTKDNQTSRSFARASSSVRVLKSNLQMLHSSQTSVKWLLNLEKSQLLMHFLKWE